MNSKDFLGKLFLGALPLIWGMITYIMAFGPGAYLGISYPASLLSGILLLLYCFHKILDFKQQQITLFCNDYKVYVPSWKWIFSLTSLLLLLFSLCFPADNSYPILQSIACGVWGSACIEELLAHILFIRYRMQLGEFLLFNFLSAFTFTLMHAGYNEVIPSLYELLSRGHFPFGFLMGIVAYKTQRIEVPIIIHALSNLLYYTVPVLIIHQELPIIIGILYSCFQSFVIACIVHKEKSALSSKNNDNQ